MFCPYAGMDFIDTLWKLRNFNWDCYKILITIRGWLNSHIEHITFFPIKAKKPEPLMRQNHELYK
jgi:hypothetical protein